MPLETLEKSGPQPGRFPAKMGGGESVGKGGPCRLTLAAAHYEGTGQAQAS